MKKTKAQKFLRNVLLLTAMLSFVYLFSSCKKDEPEPQAKDPVSSFEYEISQENYREVSFENLSQNATSYSWDFGDGETSVDENPTHTYAEAGDYTVELIAFNDDGETNSKNQDITITEPEGSLIADFDYTVEDNAVSFENLSQNATSYSWDFGDGNTSTEETPTHTYAEAGDYTVELTASNAGGETDTKNEIITISVSLSAGFDYSIDYLTVTFENLSTNATSYSWDFGDGNTSTEENPVHTYGEEGTYDVTLTASNGNGDTEEDTQSVTINTSPTELPPTPTEDEANVISVYSDAYTSFPGVDLDPDWGQETQTQEIELLGEMILRMYGLNYQAIEFAGNPQDVTGKTTIHVDIYCATATQVNFSLIGGGAENPVVLDTEAGAWKSFDIPLENFTEPDLSQVTSLKFDDAGTQESPTIFVDNIYFY
ncbi:MAG: PKD domain-containing protein [Bacteroidales bacterium]